MQLEFYRDAEGEARARRKGPGKAVARFLESDLQESAAAAREVLQAVEEVQSGRRDSWERTGNSHTLTLSAEGATIQNEMEEDAKPYHLSLPALREVVAGWISFLEEGSGDLTER
jgi:uncharacterized protein YacL (UPF0231 family)